MSDVEAQAATEHTGANTRTYLAVAVVLAVLTVTETLLPNILNNNLTLLAYLVLTGTVLKASLVALFYMHLKYDRKVYSLIILLGLCLVMYFLWLITYGQLHLIWQAPAKP
jgi:caa(3)-type oxidase subunit IV